MIQEKAVGEYSTSQRVAMSRPDEPRPITIYVLGDTGYGIVSKTEKGVTSSDVSHPVGGYDRRKFIKERHDAAFVPTNQGALDDLNEEGFMYHEKTGLFLLPKE